MGLFSFKNKEYDAMVTNAINAIDYPPVATEGDHKLNCGFDEIDGYEFLKCNVISPMQFKTKRGCVVFFSDGQEEIEVESETQEFDTDFSDTLNLGATSFVIELEPKLRSLIENSKLRTMRIVIGKKECSFNSFNIQVFKEALLPHLDEEE